MSVSETITVQALNFVLTHFLLLTITELYTQTQTIYPNILKPKQYTQTYRNSNNIHKTSKIVLSTLNAQDILPCILETMCKPVPFAHNDLMFHLVLVNSIKMANMLLSMHLDKLKMYPCNFVWCYRMMLNKSRNDLRCQM